MSLKNCIYNLNNRPIIKYDNSKRKYYISHKFYTKYYNTKNEAVENLLSVSMIDMPKSFSFKIHYLLKKK